ncbi:hypothetical protein [Leuconostoc inhae]|uniref:hypothetical protein n=1 Tax=Leuconostoc inhae TaxID=178001 RepID=UPI001C7E0399|nr:hypothetical protein [Leuconostoc inhae]
MKKAFNKFYGYQWLIAILLGFVLPLLAKQLGFREIHQVIWLYLVINGSFTLYGGYAIRKHGYSPLLILLVPAIFSGVSTFWLNIVATQYGFYFSLLYIVLSLFTFFGDTRDDPDENLIPVENGFQGLTSATEKDYSLPVDGGFKS